MAALDRLGGLAAETTLAIKAPCAVATTGASIALNGVQAIDGVTVGNNSERVLVKDQADPSTNGIYVASTGPWTLAVDASGNTDWAFGTLVAVQSGAFNGGFLFRQICTANPIIVGTSQIAFSRQPSFGQISAWSYLGNPTASAAEPVAIPSPGLRRFASAGGAVQVGPYNTVQAAAANFGPSAGQTSLDFVSVGQRYRIRQAGTITQFKIQLPSIAGITGLYLKIWRAQGAAFDLVGASENVAARIATGTNMLTLSAPVAGVQPGDYIGARVEYSAAAVQNLVSTTTPNTVLDNVPTVVYSVLNATPAAVQYNWSGETALSGSAVIVEVFMAAPIFVSMGDSITSGLPDQAAFSDNNRNSPGLSTAYPTVLGSLLNYTYQDVGIGGQNSGDMLTRFAADVVAKHPRIATLLVGANDLLQSVSVASIVDNVTLMLDQAIADGEIPIIIGVLPFRNYGLATDVMLQDRDLLNPALQALVTGAPYNGIYVSPDTLGTYYVGGPPNNLWALSVGSADGLHPGPAGQAAIARLVYNAILQTIDTTPAGAIGLFPTLPVQIGPLAADGGEHFIVSAPMTNFLTRGVPNVRVGTVGASAGAVTLDSGSDTFTIACEPTEIAWLYDIDGTITQPFTWLGNGDYEMLGELNLNRGTNPYTFSPDLLKLRIIYNHATTVFTLDDAGNLTLPGTVAAAAVLTGAPNTQTGSTYAMAAADASIIANAAGTMTITLLSPASCPGRILDIKTIASNAVVSASSNVVPLAGGAAGTAILGATAGKWARLQSDGTNWIIMAGN